MSKKVLIISASPRVGGNSDILCDQFAKGAKDAGHMTEKILLAEKKLNYCTGCYTCAERGTCIWKDDMTEILEKLVMADVIVLATPVYFYCMDAQLKTFIDRSLPRYTEMKNKDLYFITTAAEGNKSAVEGTLHGLRGYLQCLPGANEKGIVYGIGAWNKGDIIGTPAMNDAYEMGESI